MNKNRKIYLLVFLLLGLVLSSPFILKTSANDRVIVDEYTPLTLKQGYNYGLEYYGNIQINTINVLNRDITIVKAQTNTYSTTSGGIFDLFVRSDQSNLLIRYSTNGSNNASIINTNLPISQTYQVYMYLATNGLELHFVIYAAGDYTQPLFERDFDRDFEQYYYVYAGRNFPFYYRYDNNNSAVFNSNNFLSFQVTNVTNYPVYPYFDLYNTTDIYIKEYKRVWSESLENGYIVLLDFYDTLNEYELRLYPNYNSNQRSINITTLYGRLELYNTAYNRVEYFINNFQNNENIVIKNDLTNLTIYILTPMFSNTVGASWESSVYYSLNTGGYEVVSSNIEEVNYSMIVESTSIIAEEVNIQVLYDIYAWSIADLYNEGYYDGQNGENAISPFVNLITTVFTGIDSILQIEMIPHIKLWYFIAIPLTFVVLWGLFKIFKSH